MKQHFVHSSDQTYVVSVVSKDCATASEISSSIPLACLVVNKSLLDPYTLIDNRHHQNSSSSIVGLGSHL